MNRQPTVKTDLDSPDAAKHSRANYVRELHAAAKLGFQKEYTRKERKEWRTR